MSYSPGFAVLKGVFFSVIMCIADFLFLVSSSIVCLLIIISLNALTSL